MAPTKRSRPAFSPPRPGKQKPQSTSKPNDSISATSKGRKTSAAAQKRVAKPKQPASESRRRSKLVSPTPSASDSLGDDSDNEDERMQDDDDDDDDDEEDDDDDEDVENGRERQRRQNNSSPEPDYILAEVTHNSPSSDQTPTIPLSLIHHVLRSHFEKPDDTKLSTDAREVVGKYIEVFVREAIMRCAYEKSGGKEKDGQAGDGWLEVEDLEKVAVQLCLDF